MKDVSKSREYRNYVAMGLLWCAELHQKSRQCNNPECWLCDAYKVSQELADKLILNGAG